MWCNEFNHVPAFDTFCGFLDHKRLVAAAEMSIDKAWKDSRSHHCEAGEILMMLSQTQVKLITYFVLAYMYSKPRSLLKLCG